MARTASHDCPFCPRRFQFLKGLLRHILGEHGGEEVRGARVEYDRINRIVRCWCGECYSFRLFHHNKHSSRWQQHLMAKGGVCAHVLALGLGIKNDDVSFL